VLSLRARGLAYVVGIGLGILAYCASRATGHDDVARSRRHRREATAPQLAFVSPPTHVALAPTWVSDGGVGLIPIDVGPPAEPDPATGLLARTVTTRLCPGLAAAICRARDQHGCGPLLPDAADDDSAPPETCFETVLDQCASWAERHYGSEPDRMTVRERAAVLCERAVRAAVDDGARFATYPYCTELASDPAREGERCDFAYRPCGDDGYCESGSCVHTGRVGEPCVDAPCEQELACVAGLCDVPSPLGAACDDDSACDGGWCIEGRCAAFVRLGGSCQIDADCAVGVRCDERSVCVPGSRDACAEDADCGRDRFCAGLYVAHCEAIPHLGDRCDDDRACEPWLHCDAGRCASYAYEPYGRRGVGDPCAGTPDEGCAPGLRCLYAFPEDGSPPGYRCEAGAAIGEACDARQCVREAICVWQVENGHCQPTLCSVGDYFAEPDDE
jgi:hypothetical protein